MIIYKQIDNFMDPKFLPHLCGLLKNLFCQYFLLTMIEN